MTLSKFGYAATFVAAVAGFSPANDFSAVSAAHAASSQSPALSVGCGSKANLQNVVFNSTDQNRADNGETIIGKIGIKDQFYSVNPKGEVIFPVKTTVAVDYDGKNYGRYAYIIESDDKQACVRNIFRAENSSGVSQISALQIDGASVIIEGHDSSNPRQMISVLMKGTGGNTFNTQMPSGSPVAIRSHNREVPDRFKVLASLNLNNH